MSIDPECPGPDVRPRAGYVRDNGGRVVLGKHRGAQPRSRWVNISDLYKLLRSAETDKSTDP